MDVKERDALVKKIVEHVADYRHGEIAPVSGDRVLQWLAQFEAKDHATILREVERLLDQTYISRQGAKNFIAKISVSKKLAGDTPKDFWHGVGFLRLQTASQSQADMLALLNEVLVENYGLSTEKQESTAATYVYLDDVSFSGNQIKNDLAQWAQEKNITNANVHVIVIGSHTQGEYYAIYSLSKNPQRSMRPLGFSALRTPGFGATVVTYRNCPNNAPLVLWWGDPEEGPPLNQWTPLLPRRVRR